MKTNWRHMMVSALFAGSLISGCAVIIASDDHDDYDDDDCGRCHDQIVIVIPKVDTVAATPDIPR